MPIDYKKYPANWFTEIRPAILARAGNCCEFCGVRNHAQVWRSEKWIKIVLTIAHLDHDITNNDPANLRALCQRCHLHYDQEHHQRSRRKNRTEKSGQLSLFEEEGVK